MGTSHPCSMLLPSRAKLTPEQVKEIREKVKQRVHRRDIAEEYGISLSTIKDIASGRRWKGVGMDSC